MITSMWPANLRTNWFEAPKPRAVWPVAERWRRIRSMSQKRRQPTIDQACWPKLGSAAAIGCAPSSRTKRDETVAFLCRPGVRLTKARAAVRDKSALKVIGPSFVHTPPAAFSFASACHRTGTPQCREQCARRLFPAVRSRRLGFPSSFGVQDLHCVSKASTVRSGRFH